MSGDLGTLTDAEMEAMFREWVAPAVNDAAGISRQLQLSIVALGIANVLAQVAVGDRLKFCSVDQRAWLKSHAEELVLKAVDEFDGWQ